MDRYVPLPPLPERLGRLNELAYDLWWSWNPVAREVFRDLDFPLWRFTDHNPVLVLHLADPERLESAAADPDFLALYDSAVAQLDAIRAGDGSWWNRNQAVTAPVAWIAPRFALHQSLPLQSTAEAVLAGDFVKEASDLGLPFVGVGLMYPREYRHQRVSPEGWPVEALEYIDWSDAPITPARGADGHPCRFRLPMAGGEVSVAVWQVCAGRSRVFLLDTDLPENAPWHRELSGRDCSGDPDASARQSVLLGAGAVTTLAQLEIAPVAWHLSGASAAFVLFERIHRLVSNGARFTDACGHVRATTRVSVRADAPAAADTMPLATMERQVTAAWPGLQAHRDTLLAMGGQATDRSPQFNGAVLAARQCASMTVAAEGVHLSSWVSAEVAHLFDRYVDPAWRERQAGAEVWSALAAIPDEELWGVRQRLRGYLVDFMRERARRRWAREQASGSRLVALGTLFDAGTLTIGCAPSFTSTGGDLIFADLDRLVRIVTAARRPVQFVFAGRVGAGAEAGKHHLQRVFRYTMDAVFGGRLAFVEDYDLHVGRLMVQGCDAWLTLPPHGGGPSLSALKAAVNGVPHLGPSAAWYAAPEGEWMATLESAGGCVVEDSRTLYSVIEELLVPAFYDRDRSQLPARWTSMMRSTLVSALPSATARRALMTIVDAIETSA